MPRDLVTLREAFFDTDKVIRSLDKKTRRILSKFGAKTRTTAQRSMRPAPKVQLGTGQVVKGRKKKDVKYVDAVAKPGKPPYTHEKKLLRKMLFFAYDEVKKTVVIGPVKLDTVQTEGVPRLMEEGGTVQRERGGESKTLKYEAHPFMQPAFEENVGWVAQEYRN